MSEVYKAIAAVTEEMSRHGIQKNRKNQQQQYKFRGIDQVYEALSPVLAKHQLCIIPRMTERTVVERTTAKGGVLFYTTVKAEFDLVSAVDGSVHTACTYGEAMDSGDKSTNKAMSAAYKYLAFMTFAIPVEGTPDADSETHEEISADIPESVKMMVEGLATAFQSGDPVQYWEANFKAIPKEWKKYVEQQKDALKELHRKQNPMEAG